MHGCEFGFKHITINNEERLRSNVNMRARRYEMRDEISDLGMIHNISVWLVLESV